MESILWKYLPLMEVALLVHAAVVVAAEILVLRIRDHAPASPLRPELASFHNTIEVHALALAADLLPLRAVRFRHLLQRETGRCHLPRP
eukprot:7932989-Pyramimonas_sp.AAC.2